MAEKGVFKFGGSGSGKHAGDIHVRVAGAGKTKINHANHFIVFVEQNVAEIKIAVNKVVGLGVFDVVVVGIDMFFVVLVVEFVEELAERIFDFGGSGAEIDTRKFFDEFGDVISGAGESGVGKVVDAVAEGITINFFVDGKGAAGGIVV